MSEKGKGNVSRSDPNASALTEPPGRSFIRVPQQHRWSHLGVQLAYTHQTWTKLVCSFFCVFFFVLLNLRTGSAHQHHITKTATGIYFTDLVSRICIINCSHTTREYCYYHNALISESGLEKKKKSWLVPGEQKRLIKSPRWLLFLICSSSNITEL